MIDFNYSPNRKGTYSTQWDFIKDRFGQKDLLPFTISDMDICTSKEIIQALQKRVSHGIFGYTRWDHDDYKQAIILWYQQRFQTMIQNDWIAYAPSVIYAIVRLFNLLNVQKKGVCLITPCYDGFIKILKGNSIPYRTSAMKDQSIDWALLEQNLSKSSAFLLCNPNNPNGHLWSKEELSTIVQLCQKHDVWIISDDIHMDFVYKPHQFIPIIKIAQELNYEQKTIIVTSSSKTFNLSGLGGAYMLCPDQNVKKLFVTTLKEVDSLSSAMVLHVESLICAYNTSDYWINELCSHLYSNHKLLFDFFVQNDLAMRYEIPKATYFAWIDCSQMSLTSLEIQDKLIHKGKVAIMNGDIYQELKPFLRMNIACSKDKILDGLQRLKSSFIL